MFIKLTRYWFILLSVCCSSALGQNETSKWYFGNGAGLDFMTNPPTVITTNSLTEPAGCASAADANGNLLFYTNGNVIYDQTNATMANGSGLSGNNAASQSALIVKQPNSSSLYYVFTLGQANFCSFDYSIVDMSLASGNGSVTVKNVLLNSKEDEKLSAARHCNGTDFWIIAHSTAGNSYCAYLLSAAGLNTIAVVSSIGYSLYGFNGGLYGYMKVSPNGKKLAAGYWM